MNHVSLNGWKVSVVSEDAELRKFVAQCLRPRGHIAQPFASGETFQAVGSCAVFDCSILDTSISKPDALELLREARASGDARPVILVGGPDELRTAVTATKLGASEFLTRPVDEAQLLEAVDAACDARPLCAPAIDPVAKAKIDMLSSRQRQVLLGIAQGKLNKIIAYDLGLSVRTVEAYRAGVMDKVGGTIADAIRVASSGGLLPPCVACVAARTFRFETDRPVQYEMQGNCPPQE